MKNRNRKADKTDIEKRDLVEERIAENKRKLIDALEKNKGIVYYACRMVNITRDTYYRYLKTDPTFEEEAKRIKEEQIDIVEAQLLNAIANKNLTAIIFYLKTQGKHRGYIETTEIQGALDSASSFIDLSSVPEELKRQIAEHALGLSDEGARDE